MGRGGLWFALILAVLMVSLAIHVRRAQQRRLGPPPPPVGSGVVRSETALAAAAVLAALDARPAGVPVRSAGTDRPGDPHLRELFRVEPAALLVPFDNTAGGSLRGVPVAHGTLVVTNQYLQFNGDQASDVVWPVRDIHELVVTPEGLFLRTDGVSTVRGVGAGPGWAPLLPLLVEWASAVHTDDSLESVRARVRRLATGATGL